MIVPPVEATSYGDRTTSEDELPRYKLLASLEPQNVQQQMNKIGITMMFLSLNY